MEKNRLTVTINGRMYTLVSEETPEYMDEISAYVNEKVAEVKKNNPGLLGERPIVLAALNICDEYLKAEKGGKLLLDKASRKYDEIVAENKELRGLLNDSEYEIDIAALRHQLENANNEIARLKKKLGGSNK
ncbi:MAG: cell division protein ZapA [Clostridia bacterium]|nr:cell division protein ZapA [Clostridia bacterium]